MPRVSRARATTRDRLLEAEIELRRQIDAVAAQRRRLPLGGGEVPIDYRFEESAPTTNDSKSIRLSELFAPEKDTLLL